MNTLIRIILSSDSSIHAIVANKKVVLCNAECLLRILINPRRFYEQEFFLFQDTTKDINRAELSIEDVPGLTLLRVNMDNQIVCDFPYLFELLFSHVEIKDTLPLYAKVATLSDTLADEKVFLLSLYQNLASLRSSGLTLERKLELSEDAQFSIFREIVNTHFSELATQARADISTLPSNTTEQTQDVLLSSRDTEPDAVLIPKTHISYIEYAKKHQFVQGTVYNWCRSGKMLSAIRNKAGHWFVDPNERPVDRRAARKVLPKDSSGRKQIRLKGDTYEDIQEYIRDRRLVSDAIRPYIRDYKEAKYYEKNNYHEVCWDGFSYLIIDIVPEYYCKTKGKTNRQLIEEGHAPLVPNNEQYAFHIHHIGQKKDSPLAIIPQQDHIGLFSIFHKESTTNEDLHDREFEARKQYFLLKYLQVYDAYGNYRKIPFLNSKHTQNPPFELKEVL